MRSLGIKMKFTYVITTVLFTFFFVNCANDTQNEIEVIESKLDREVHLSIHENEILTLTEGNNKFAFTLFEKINSDNQHSNILFSPYSISRSLAKIRLGADILGIDEVDSAANFIMSYYPSRKTFNALDLWLNYSDNNYTFTISNAMWLKKGIPVSDEYLDNIKINYGDNIKTIDYSTSAKKSINSWVQNDTLGRIDEIIPNNTITPKTKLILTDTAYFQNAWFYPFDQNKTQNDTFSMLDGSTKSIPFIYQGGGCIHYPYYRGDNYQFLNLDLASWGYNDVAEGYTEHHLKSHTTMNIILPDIGEFDNIIQNLDSIYAESKDNLSEQEITVKMPKFNFMTPSYDMKKYLKDMDINRVFDNNESLNNLSNGGNVKIDNMFHKMSIAMDENGIEAKTASNGIMTCEGFTDYTVNFNANRPFIFLVKDKQTKQILFIGALK